MSQYELSKLSYNSSISLRAENLGARSCHAPKVELRTMK